MNFLQDFLLLDLVLILPDASECLDIDDCSDVCRLQQQLAVLQSEQDTQRRMYRNEIMEVNMKVGNKKKET